MSGTLVRHRVREGRKTTDRRTRRTPTAAGAAEGRRRAPRQGRAPVATSLFKGGTTSGGPELTEAVPPFNRDRGVRRLNRPSGFLLSSW
jgi:hypothetical protein